MSTKDESLPLKLLTNEWDKVKCKARSAWNILACPGGTFKEKMGLQDQVLDIKIIKNVLDQIEGEEFEMPLQHKSKLQVYRKLKQEMGFVECLEYVKGAPSRLFLSFVGVPMGCLSSWVGR